MVNKYRNSSSFMGPVNSGMAGRVDGSGGGGEEAGSDGNNVRGSGSSLCMSCDNNGTGIVIRSVPHKA